MSELNIVKLEETNRGKHSISVCLQHCVSTVTVGNIL